MMMIFMTIMVMIDDGDDYFIDVVIVNMIMKMI